MSDAAKTMEEKRMKSLISIADLRKQINKIAVPPAATRKRKPATPMSGDAASALLPSTVPRYTWPASNRANNAGLAPRE
jgi:hypothetical protein